MSSGRGNGGSGGNGGGSFAPTYFEYNDPGGSGYYGLAYRQVREKSKQLFNQLFKTRQTA